MIFFQIGMAVPEEPNVVFEGAREALQLEVVVHRHRRVLDVPSDVNHLKTKTENVGSNPVV
jgi:hypothetical protein